MPTVHFLNVGNGDCTIIEHGSGHVTMIDICCGNLEESKEARTLASLFSLAKIGGNFGMCDHPTNPIDYLKQIGKTDLFRFILSHPDMDHLDGFLRLRQEIGFSNFWDSGVRKAKPDFGEGCRYKEEDWNEYAAVIEGKRQRTTIVTPRAGSNLQFANLNADGSEGGDYLSIVAPSNALVNAANQQEDCNDGSYVLVYRTCGGNIVFPGDAHDDTWNYVLTHHLAEVQNCAVLIAPHHGRKSERSYEFLDKINPALTLLGCAPCEHLCYNALNYRQLPFITNNQAGNIILDAGKHGIDVYVENRSYAEKRQGFDAYKQKHGCYYIGYVPKPA